MVPEPLTVCQFLIQIWQRLVIMVAQQRQMHQPVMAGRWTAVLSECTRAGCHSRRI